MRERRARGGAEERKMKVNEYKYKGCVEGKIEKGRGRIRREMRGARE